MADVNDCNECLTAIRLIQDYGYHKPRVVFQILSRWEEGRSGLVVEPYTSEREVVGYHRSDAVLCPWARHI